MLKSTVVIIVLRYSTSQGHICLADKKPRYLSFPPWHKLYHRLLMAPIHHDTNAFTNVFLSLGCLARLAPPSSQEPSGSQGYLPPPSLLPDRFDSSISPSCDSAALSVRPNDAENKKLPTFFFFNRNMLPAPADMIGTLEGGARRSPPLLHVQMGYIMITYI